MAKFKYTAIGKDKKQVEGTIESPSERNAKAQLAAQALVVVKISEVKSLITKKVKKPLIGSGIKSLQITIFTRQMAILLKAGLPLLRALEVISRQEKNIYLKDLIENLADNVRTGNKFSDGLTMYPNVFDKLYINMVKAGEAGGVLHLVLDRIAMFSEKAQKTTNKVKGAMVYPIIILLVAVVIVAVLMVFVVPQFQQIFNDMLNGAAMPGLTQMIINISDFMKDHIFVTLGIIAAVVAAIKLFFKTRIGIKLWDTAILRIPKVGDLAIKTIVGRFTRTLGTLIASGVPILESLSITKGTINNTIVVGALERVHDRVRDGENIATPLDQQNIFPGMVTSMVEVGEETGQLADMMNRIADNYDEEVDNAVTAVTAIIEPVMIVFLAVVVGTIVIALFLPIIEIVTKMSS
ncbi:MAG: type II secretion system F family protein [Opitutales bacterium]